MTSAMKHDVGVARIWTESQATWTCVLNVIGGLQCGGFLLGRDRQVMFLNRIARAMGSRSEGSAWWR